MSTLTIARARSAQRVVLVATSCEHEAGRINRFGELICAHCGCDVEATTEDTTCWA